MSSETGISGYPVIIERIWTTLDALRMLGIQRDRILLCDKDDDGPTCIIVRMWSGKEFEVLPLASRLPLTRQQAETTLWKFRRAAQDGTIPDAHLVCIRKQWTTPHYVGTELVVDITLGDVAKRDTLRLS